MSDTYNDRPFRWYAAEKIERLEAEIEDLKDDKRVFLSHLNLLADLLTPDQAAKARKLLDATPRMEFLSKTFTLQQENATLRKLLKLLSESDQHPTVTVAEVAQYAKQGLAAIGEDAKP